MPLYVMFLGIFSLSSLAFPGTNSFVGELLVLFAVFAENKLLAAFAIPGLYCVLEGEDFRYTIRIPANDVLMANIRHLLTRPVGRPSRKPKVYYATQVSTAPPTIVLFVNYLSAFPETYQRYVISRLRELLPFCEIPIRLFLRERRHGPG